MDVTALVYCPHCGGLHLGQKFDNCTYVNLLKDPNATAEQKRNAQDWLDCEEKSKIMNETADE